MKFKYPQFFVLFVFIVPMLACSTFFGSSEEPQNPETSITESDSDAPLAVVANDSEPAADDASAQDASTENSASQDSESAADNQAAADGSGPATTIQPALAINTDALPFQTYRAEMVMTTTSGDDFASMTLISQRDIPNQAMSFEVSAIGVPDMEDFGGGTMTIAMTDGTIYIPVEGECMAMDAGGETPMDQFLAGSNEFFDEENVPVLFLADETILGLPVKTYAVTGLGDADMTNVDGNVSVYTTADGQEIVLRAEMMGTSDTNPITDAPGSTTISYSFTISDVDLALNIGIPAGCENAMRMPNIGGLMTADDTGLDSAGDPDDGAFPTYPGSEFLANVAGVQSLMIPQSAIDAAQVSPVDFYVQAFAEQGYAVTQETTAGPSTTLMFQGNGSSVQVVIVEEADTVTVTVLGLP